MFGIILDLTYMTTKFVLINTYYGLKYLIYGAKVDPLEQRLALLEYRMNSKDDGEKNIEEKK